MDSPKPEPPLLEFWSVVDDDNKVVASLQTKEKVLGWINIYNTCYVNRDNFRVVHFLEVRE